MGVWIETRSRGTTWISTDVTPCMGVWIETSVYILPGYIPKSHPVWVCGLKLPVAGRIGSLGDVTPCMGVWIETLIFFIICQVL